MASKDDYSSPDRKGKKPTRKGPHDIIKKTAVVLREGVVYKNKETNEVFVPATIKPDQGLRQEISFTKSMTPEEIEKVLKNTFPFLAKTKRFFCTKRVQKKKLDFCGERRIWSGEVLNREITGKSLLYIYCEEENSDQDPSLTAQMEKMQISRNESSSEDCGDSSFETCDIPEEKSLSLSKIGEVKDSPSLEKVTSVLKDKQQTEEQRGEDESESFEETLSENQATSPSTIDKGKDSTSPEEVISVPVDKQQTEEQSGEDESEPFKETLSVGPATCPSTIDKGTDSTSLEEVISVPMDKQQTEEQSEDKTESFEVMLGVGPAAQDHDIKGKTTTFEAAHKECTHVLPYTNASGQVYVQLVGASLTPGSLFLD